MQTKSELSNEPIAESVEDGEPTPLDDFMKDVEIISSDEVFEVGSANPSDTGGDSCDDNICDNNICDNNICDDDDDNNVNGAEIHEVLPIVKPFVEDTTDLRKSSLTNGNKLFQSVRLESDDEALEEDSTPSALQPQGFFEASSAILMGFIPDIDITKHMEHDGASDAPDAPADTPSPSMRHFKFPRIIKERRRSSNLSLSMSLVFSEHDEYLGDYYQTNNLSGIKEHLGTTMSALQTEVYDEEAEEEKKLARIRTQLQTRSANKRRSRRTRRNRQSRSSVTRLSGMMGFSPRRESDGGLTEEPTPQQTTPNASATMNHLQLLQKSMALLETSLGPEAETKDPEQQQQQNRTRRSLRESGSSHTSMGSKVADYAARNLEKSMALIETQLGLEGSKGSAHHQPSTVVRGSRVTDYAAKHLGKSVALLESQFELEVYDEEAEDEYKKQIIMANAGRVKKKKKKMQREEGQQAIKDEDKPVTLNYIKKKETSEEGREDVRVQHNHEEKEDHGREESKHPNQTTQSSSGTVMGWGKRESIKGLRKSLSVQVSTLSGLIMDVLSDGNMKKQEEALRKQKENVATKYVERAEQLSQEGKWSEALYRYNRALCIQRELLGKDDLAVGRTLNGIGCALMNLGETYGALTALEEALFIRQEALCGAHQDVVETANNITKVLAIQNEIDSRGRLPAAVYDAGTNKATASAVEESAA